MQVGALGAGGGARGRRALQQERGTHGRQARGASDSRRGDHSAAGAGLAAQRAAGPAGCALGLFLTRFDSVLFLSQFLDIVREPGSSQNFLNFFIKLNKNEIKSNKIRQNFRKNKIFKNEIFENKIFVENNILNAKLIALHYM